MTSQELMKAIPKQKLDEEFEDVTQKLKRLKTVQKKTKEIEEKKKKDYIKKKEDRKNLDEHVRKMNIKSKK